jgi:hypothetical protein
VWFIFFEVFVINIKITLGIKNILKAVLGFLPTIAFLIFVGPFIYSATLYSGLSQANLNSVGFLSINNYWCNLTNEQGMNGQLNPAMPFAMSALVILCQKNPLLKKEEDY